MGPPPPPPPGPGVGGPGIEGPPSPPPVGVGSVGSALVEFPGGSGSGGSGPFTVPPSMKSGKLKGPLPGRKSPQPKVSVIINLG